MKTIRLESTDADDITTATTVFIDFDNTRSVEQGIIRIVNFLERLGLELPEDVQDIISQARPAKKQYLKG